MTADTFDLALHTGDVAYGSADLVGGPSYTQYDNWLFGIYPWMRSHPFYPAIGNHDDEINHASAYRDVFVLPEEGASTAYPDNAERYYSFDYGPIHFVALDTEFALLDPGRQQAQLSWLDADLAATTQPWRVVYFHRSPYSSGAEHGSALDVRQAISPILERRGVQLVLSGHDHDFERSIPWREFVSNGSAITYVVTGGGGAALYAVGASDWTARSASLNHYMRMTASGCTMTIEAVGLDGSVFDQTSIDRCAAANQPPQVTLTAPQSDASYTAPGTVPISGTASDDGRRRTRLTAVAHCRPLSKWRVRSLKCRRSAGNRGRASGIGQGTRERQTVKRAREFGLSLECSGAAGAHWPPLRQRVRASRHL